ncbi:hypothetical protein F5887DRAFT_919603 [Amanita rubescens]|nr:hypothetical protein F5887DRAFT_919603 [Amanita rubescens]
MLFLKKALVTRLSIEVKRNVRKDDPGLLTITGFSAGARSKLTFGTAAVFTLFWNLCRSWLPPAIISDIDKFVAAHNMPAMDPAAATPAQEGSYKVMIGDTDFDFHDVRLAPPMGMMASNYARAMHTDKQPHEWAISWNTSRLFPDAEHGGNFFFGAYGIRVQNAPNTLIAWKPGKYHGTSLQKVKPTLKATDFRQTGLAIVTSNRLPAAWKKFLNNEMSKEEVVNDIASGEEAETDVAYK